jgi:hypothetical protein
VFRNAHVLCWRRWGEVEGGGVPPVVAVVVAVGMAISGGNVPAVVFVVVVVFQSPDLQYSSRRLSSSKLTDRPALDGISGSKLPLAPLRATAHSTRPETLECTNPNPVVRRYASLRRHGFLDTTVIYTDNHPTMSAKTFDQFRRFSTDACKSSSQVPSWPMPGTATIWTF